LNLKFIFERSFTVISVNKYVKEIEYRQRFYLRDKIRFLMYLYNLVFFTYIILMFLSIINFRIKEMKSRLKPFLIIFIYDDRWKWKEKIYLLIFFILKSSIGQQSANKEAIMLKQKKFLITSQDYQNKILSLKIKYLL